MLQYNTPTGYQYAKNQMPPGVGSEDREALILAHLPKVKYIADRFAAKLPSSVTRDDLYGAGVVGLIDAVERYDASRGVAFTTFAELRVRGAILDNLRSLDWASRATRRRGRELQAAYAELEQQNQRPATEAEVAAHMNVPIAEVIETLQDMRGLAVTNLDERDELSGLSAMDTVKDKGPSPFEKLETEDQRRRLSEAVENLPERERRVIALYYIEELTMKEIGAVLGVTESRVSQLKTQAVVRLRAGLAK